MDDLEQLIISEIMHTTKDERVDALIELEKIEFENKRYGSLLRTIATLTLENKDVDLVSVYQTNQEFKAEELSRISSLAYSAVFLPSHINLLKIREHKKNVLKEIDEKRKAITECNNLEELDKNKNKLILELSGLTIEDRSSFIKISDYKKLIEKHLNSKKGIEGYSWGISDLDHWTSGIVTPRVHVIGGLKKSGKTRFLIHTLSHLHKQKIPTAFLSLEMPGYEITKLLHSAFTGIQDIRFRSVSILKREELQAFRDVEIDESLLGIECKSGLGLEEIISRMRRYAKMGFKVIAIDYIQRIDHDRHKQAQELEDISIKLADSAREHNFALILLSQLNALGEREAPNMGHLKGSGGIGEAADTIFLFDNLYRRTKDEKDKGKIDIFIEQRHGDSGKCSILSDLGSCKFFNEGGNYEVPTNQYSAEIF